MKGNGEQTKALKRLIVSRRVKKKNIITTGGQLVGGTDPRVTLRLVKSKKDSTLLLFLFTYF
jgi:hypothetical protein